jgi:hypothetical protein
MAFITICIIFLQFIFILADELSSTELESLQALYTTANGANWNWRGLSKEFG